MSSCPDMAAHRDACRDPDCEICFAWVNGADDYQQALLHAEEVSSPCPFCGVTVRFEDVPAQAPDHVCPGCWPEWEQSIKEWNA